jgi:hypothetical protein
MKVYEVIAELGKMPAGADVYIDPNLSHEREDGERIYLATKVVNGAGGEVIISDAIKS